MLDEYSIEQRATQILDAPQQGIRPSKLGYGGQHRGTNRGTNRKITLSI